MLQDLSERCTRYIGIEKRYHRLCTHASPGNSYECERSGNIYRSLMSRASAAPQAMAFVVMEAAWQTACGTMRATRPDQCWDLLLQHTPPDSLWHSLHNCVAHQVATWMELLASGIEDASQPAAFKIALLLRHTPIQHAETIVNDLLEHHPQAQDLSSYIVTLLSDDEASGDSGDEGEPPCAAPLRDLQLFGDCELAVLGAPPAPYERHAALVRCEYRQLTDSQYNQLRIKVLEQFSRIPVVFHTPEFAHFEPIARTNIEREIARLKMNGH